MKKILFLALCMVSLMVPLGVSANSPMEPGMARDHPPAFSASGKKIFDAHKKNVTITKAKYKAAVAGLDAAILSGAPAQEIKAAREAVIKAFGAMLDERVLLSEDLVKEGILKLPPIFDSERPRHHRPHEASEPPRRP